MCGVAGILSISELINPEPINKMARSLAHRGPDGYNTYQEKYFHNSHNLLSLHSKKTKPGPYISQNKRWALSFNGEIYNHLELKKEIDSHNLIDWKHHSDAEILLEGWSLEGKDFLKKINGMFAFSIWDQVNQVLFLASDRISEKNLYYTKWNDQFLFSSEIKSFKSLNYPLSLNHNKIGEYLSYRYVSGTETLFKNIYKLQQGEILEVSRDLNIQSYRYNQNLPKYELQDNNTQTLQKLLHSSIEQRTSSVYTNSIFLSSGLDSSLIANNIPPNSYAFTLQSDTSADLSEIYKLCKKKQLIHVNVSSPQDITSLLDECLLAVEEPLGDSIQISNMLLAQAAKKHQIRVGLTGDGADEIFAGYIHHLAYSVLLNLEKNWGHKILKGLSQCLQLIPEILISHLTPYSQKLGTESKARLILVIDRFLKRQSFISEMTQIFKIPHLNSEIYQSESHVNTLKDLLNHDKKHWLPNYVLLRNDKILMSQGIEGRHPYLDHRLISFADTLTTKELINGFERKSILKKASLVHLSHKIAYQKKKSFVIDFDINQLIHNTKFTNSFLKDLVKSGQINFNEPTFIDRKKIFSILVLQRWMNLYGLN